MQWATLLFATGYAAAAVGLSLAATEFAAGYAAGLTLLVILSAWVFLGGLRNRAPAGQRFYLVLSIVPALTIARFAFAGLALPILDPILTYLLLAVTILAFRETTGSGIRLRGSNRTLLVRALVLGGPLAVGLAIFGFVLLTPGTLAADSLPLLSAAALAPVALLDELWFRGFLQGSVSDATSTGWGWIATAVIFTAYGVPFSSPAVLAFRAGYGVLLGALATRPENVPATWVARTAMSVVLILLLPGLAGTSAIV